MGALCSSAPTPPARCAGNSGGGGSRGGRGSRVRYLAPRTRHDPRLPPIPIMRHACAGREWWAQSRAGHPATSTRAHARLPRHRPPHPPLRPRPRHQRTRTKRTRTKRARTKRARTKRTRTKRTRKRSRQRTRRPTSRPRGSRPHRRRHPRRHARRGRPAPSNTACWPAGACTRSPRARRPPTRPHPRPYPRPYPRPHPRPYPWPRPHPQPQPHLRPPAPALAPASAWPPAWLAAGPARRRRRCRWPTNPRTCRLQRRWYVFRGGQFHPDGGQFDSARPSARTMHPHAGPQYVQMSWRVTGEIKKIPTRQTFPALFFCL